MIFYLIISTLKTFVERLMVHVFLRVTDLKAIHGVTTWPTLYTVGIKHISKWDQIN